VNWVEYAETAAHLSGVRQREARRRAEAAERHAGVRTSIDGLHQRLAAQHGHLADTANLLHAPLPSSEPQPAGEGEPPLPSSGGDPAEAVRLAWDAVHRADAYTRDAQRRGSQPLLFPQLRPAARGALVYGLAAFLSGVFAVGLIVFSPVLGVALAAPLAACALPLVAFAAGYTTLATAGRSRISGSDQPGIPVPVGFGICVIGTWAIIALSVVVSALLGH
jgi:hypothetical protein